MIASPGARLRRQDADVPRLTTPYWSRMTGPPPAVIGHAMRRAARRASSTPNFPGAAAPAGEAQRETVCAGARRQGARPEDEDDGTRRAGGSVTGRSLTLVISIMCFLACLTAGAV